MEKPRAKNNKKPLPRDDDSAVYGGSSSLSTTASQQRTEKKTPKYKKPQATIIQPPMWSPRAAATKQITLIEEPTTAAKPKPSVPKLVPKPRPEKVEEPVTPTHSNLSMIEEEFDILKFLEKLRSVAIEYRNKKKYKQLSELYSIAIDNFPKNPDFHCNRSYAFHKMEYYGKSLDDANKAIELNDLYKRAYYRRAAAYIGLGKLLYAFEDYEQLMKLCPTSENVKCKYLHCQNALKKRLFDTVLSDNMSDFDSEDLVNVETVKVENSYGGPKLVENRVQPGFIWRLMRFYQAGGLLHRKYVYMILLFTENYFKKMNTLINIDFSTCEDDITVCGDVQGQLYDLIYIIESNGFPTNKHRYLFNGNFIGKGSFSVECALLLFSFKLAFPNKFFITRGHHECIAMTKIFGFQKEVCTKYCPIVYQMFSRVFQWLPLAHCINKKVLVLHGGLFSDSEMTLLKIREYPRNVEPEEGETLMCDILWSDPQDGNGKQDNSRGRGGILFGPDITEAFLKANDLDYIIRSHEYKENGYQQHHNGKCITIFSAPNYCDTYGNKGCYIKLTSKDLESKLVHFDAQIHPPIPPLFYADAIYRILF